MRRHATPEVTHSFHSHSFPTQPFNIIPHSPVDYRQVFKPILLFQPSPSQSDSRLYPTPLFTVSATDLRELFYSQAFFTLHSLYLGKRTISLGVTIILSMCLCPHTYLDCKQFTIISRFVFIHVKTIKNFACGENFDKTYGAAATLISNHKTLK